MSNSSFTYKGTDFGAANYGVYVTGPQYQRMPRPRVNVDDYAQADGAAVQGSTFGMREIRLECKMVSDNDTNRRIQMDNLVGKLATSQEGGGDLIIDMFPDKTFTNARLTSDLTAVIHARMEEFTLEFIADPWASAGTASTDTGNIDGSGETTL